MAVAWMVICRARLREATMNQDWQLKDLIAVVPLLASAFAFAYVVGYFLAFDIAWFPFFSLSEHVVFAIRALPVAIAALVILLIVTEFPHLLKRATRAWVIFLAFAAVIAVLGNHLGLAAGFVAVAIAANIHNKKSETNMSSATILNLAAQLMMTSIIIGFASGNAWRLYSYLPDYLHGFPFARTMHVHLKGDNGTDPHEGHVIFVGDSRILIYEYKMHQVQLYQWKDIQEVHESGPDEPQTTPATSSQR
jgi:hypothetical protein